MNNIVNYIAKYLLLMAFAFGAINTSAQLTEEQVDVSFEKNQYVKMHKDTHGNISYQAGLHSSKQYKWNTQNDDITVEAWVYDDDTDEHGNIAVNIMELIPYNRGLGFGRHEHKLWLFGDAGASKVTDQVWEHKAWHHIALVYKASTGSISLYFNGQSVLTDYKGNFTNPGQGYIVVGGWDIHNRKYGNPWIGNIDEYRVWKKAMSAKEVQHLMQQSIKPSEAQKMSELVAYYRFEETNPANGMVNNSSQGADLNMVKYEIPQFSSDYSANNRLGKFEFVPTANTQGKVTLKWNATWLQWEKAKVTIQVASPDDPNNWKDFTVKEFNKADISLISHKASVDVYLIPGYNYKYKVDYGYNDGTKNIYEKVKAPHGTEWVAQAPSFYGNGWFFKRTNLHTFKFDAVKVSEDIEKRAAKLEWTVATNTLNMLNNATAKGNNGWYIRIDHASTNDPNANWQNLTYSVLAENISSTKTSYIDESPDRCKYNYYRYYIGVNTPGISYANSSFWNSISHGLIQFPIEAPRNVTFEGDDCNVSATIKWENGSQNENPTGYLLKYRTKNQDGSWSAWSADIDHSSTTTEYVHVFDNPSEICQYSVAAKYPCGISDWHASNKEIKLEDITAVYDEKSLSASKGYNPQQVDLDIALGVKGNYGLIDKALIYRRVNKSNALPNLLATIDGSEVKYTDASAQTGILYEYFVIGKKTCSGNNRYSFDINTLNGKSFDEISDKSGVGYAIGFRYAEGIITGKIAYEGGFPVPNTKVFVSPEKDETLGHSLYFNGSGAYAQVDQPENFNTDSAFTISLMVKFNKEASGNYEMFFNFNMDFYFYRLNDMLAVKISRKEGQTRFINFNVDNDLITNEKFNNITFVYDGSTAYLYINGKLMNSEDIGKSNIENSYSQFIIGGMGKGYSFKGFIDDVKIYNRGFTTKEVYEKYNSIVPSNDPGLVSFWRFDEGSGNMAYDISTTNNVPNKNDLTLYNTKWSNDVPSMSELGYTAMTNENGNYSIRGIMYTNGGENFLVSPAKNDGGYDHVYDPSRGKTVFIGDESQVINGVDFKDVSSFTFAGRVLYEGYTEGTHQCGSAGVGFAIDGRRVLVDGKPYETGQDGNFDFQVPIGEHTIELIAANREFDTKKVTHTFTNHWNRSTPFIDKTKVKVVGRVIGGNAEANKPCKPGATNNNLGVATVKFETLSGCIVESTKTGEKDGYYEIMLPPAKYKMHVKIDNADDTWQSGDEKFKFGTLTQVDVSLPQWKEEYDSVFTTNDVNQKVFDRLDTIKYQYKRDVVYQSPMEIAVTARDGKSTFVGSDSVVFYDGAIKKMLHLYEDDDRSKPSKIGYPLFLRGYNYSLKLFARESYTNFDSKKQFHYPVGNTDVHVNNELGQGFKRNEELGTAEYYEPGQVLKTNNKGVLDYSFTVGEANILPSGSESYLRSLGFTVVNNKATAHWPVDDKNSATPFYAYVFGSGDAPGNDFVTRTPEMVDFILRDPGGSNSYAYLEKGSSFTETHTFTSVSLGGVHLENEFKLGPKQVISGGIVPLPQIEIKAEATSKNDITNENHFTLDNAWVSTSTIGSRIETSQNSNYTGAQSDLYIGKSTNILMSLTPAVTMVKKADSPVAGLSEVTIDGEVYVVGIKEKIISTPQSIQTTFVYDEYHIINHLIPNLKLLRNSYFDDPKFAQYYTTKLGKTDSNYGVDNDKHPQYNASSNPQPSYAFKQDLNSKEEYARLDQVRWANQQIRLWEFHIAANEKAKLQANSPIDNVSISGGSVYEHTTTNSKTFTFNSIIELAIADESSVEEGVTVSGIGADMTVGILMGETLSTGNGYEESSETTVGYVISDPETTDYFTIDVYEGSKTRGPIFKTKGGRSSCPWEGPEYTKYHEPGKMLSPGTIQVDKPQLEIPVNYVDNVPANMPAVFNVKLKNASVSKDDMDYQLYVVQGSNPYGAVIKIDGHDISNAWTYSIPYGDSIEATLTIERGPIEYEYKDIKIAFASLCDGNDYASSEKTITAMFTEECSPIDMLIPANNWVLNVASNDSLSVFMNNYALQHKNFDKITFQYKTQAEPYYQDLVHFYLNSENEEFKQNKSSADAYKLLKGAEYLNYDFVMDDQYPDNYYTVRAKTTCNDVIGYSNSVSGIKDTQVPQVFGNTEPANGVLTNNDVIGVRFNEPINPITLSRNTIFLTGKMNGSKVQHDASIQFGTSTQDKVEINDLDLSHRSFTLEFYTQKKENETGTQILFNHGFDPNNDFVVGFNNENNLFVELGNKTITTKSAINNYWTHYAISFDADNGNIEIFINGVLQLDVAVNGSITEYGESGKLVIGNVINANGTGYKGKIHEVRLWKKPLNAADIALYKAIELVGNEAGLWYNWPMNELKGSIATDKVRLKQAAMKANWNAFPVGYALTGFSNSAIGKTACPNIGKDKDFTIEFWFAGSGINKSILSNGTGKVDAMTDQNENGWDISLNDDGKIQVATNAKKITSDKRYNDGKWHHVALIKRAQANVTLYVDGNKQGELAGADTKGFSATSLYLGARGYYLGNQEHIDQRFIDGSFDELRIWNLARKIDQVKRDMNITLSGKEKGLIKYYPFDIYVDATGNYESSYKAQNYIDDKNRDKDEFKLTTELKQSTPLMRLPQPTQRILSNYLLNNDQVVITPTVKSSLIENVLLDVTILGVEDLQGNPSDPITWTAYVDKNQVIWDNEEFKREHEFGKEMILEAKIVNKGGLNTYYELKNVPSWITIEETEGYIEPLSTKTVELKIAAGVAVGRHTDDIILMTDFGFGEKLSLDIDIYKAMPNNWVPVTDKYSNTMTLTGQLKINDVISRNKRDALAAFVNGECRGLAKLTYNNIFDAWYIEMSVAGDIGDQVTYKIWNGSAGEVLALESVNNQKVKQFTSANYGTLNNPLIFTGGNSIESIFEVHEGYNWISFNTINSNATNAPYVLKESVTAAKNDKISNKEGEQLTYDSKNKIWLGNLSSLALNVGYKYYANEASTFHYVGAKADPSLYSVNLKAGWNWIGILGTKSIEVNSALSNYSAKDGDFIKSKNAFAQYYDGTGWQGSLKYFEPNQMYMVNVSADASFTYPQASSKKAGTINNEDILDESPWEVNANQYADHMDVTASICNVSADYGIVGAFINDKCRGYSKLDYSEATGQYVVYLPIHGNSDDVGKTVTYKFFDGNNSEIYELSNQLNYKLTEPVGNAFEPYCLEMNATGYNVESSITNNLQPNPATSKTYLTFSANTLGKEKLCIYDMVGRIVHSEEVNLIKGENRIEIDVKSIKTGTYVLIIKSDELSITEKLIINR